MCICAFQVNNTIIFSDALKKYNLCLLHTIQTGKVTLILCLRLSTRYKLLKLSNKRLILSPENMLSNSDWQCPPATWLQERHGPRFKYSKSMLITFVTFNIIPSFPSRYYQDIQDTIIYTIRNTSLPGLLQLKSFRS